MVLAKYSWQFVDHCCLQYKLATLGKMLGPAWGFGHTEQEWETHSGGAHRGSRPSSPHPHISLTPYTTTFCIMGDVSAGWGSVGTVSRLMREPTATETWLTCCTGSKRYQLCLCLEVPLNDSFYPPDQISWYGIPLAGIVTSFALLHQP